MSLPLPPKKMRVPRRSEVKSISNQSRLKTFMTKNITIAIKDDLDVDFDITVVPNRTHVYQGVTAYVRLLKAKRPICKGVL